MLTDTIKKCHHFVKAPFWQKDDKPIFIYGTGTVGRDVYRVLSQNEINISGFMDHRSRESSFANNCQIYQPNDDAILSAVRHRAMIILAIHNREVYLPGIIENLKILGYNNFVSIIDLYDFFSHDLGVRYWLTRRDIFQDFEHEISVAYNLFSDETSREVYTATLRFRIT